MGGRSGNQDSDQEKVHGEQMKTAEEYAAEIDHAMGTMMYPMATIEGIVRKALRDAWEAGAKAEREAIINDVWGSWAQSECEKAPTAPFPEGNK